MSECDEWMLKLFHFRSFFKTKSSPSQVKDDIARHNNILTSISKPSFTKIQRLLQEKSRNCSWLVTSHQPVDLSTIKRNTLDHYIHCQLKKLTVSGSLERVRGSGGQNKTPPRVVARIKSLIKTTWWSRTWSPPSPSISRLCTAVIDLQGRQINKKDY